MKLRYKILYMSFGAMLVVLGIVLNSLVSGDGYFNRIICRSLMINGDDEKTIVAYLGRNAGGEMFQNSHLKLMTGV